MPWPFFALIETAHSGIMQAKTGATIMTLSEYRRAAGLTQEALAMRAGTTAQMIRDLEEGRQAIGDMHLADALVLAKALGITAEQLAESEYIYGLIAMTPEDIEAIKKKAGA